MSKSCCLFMIYAILSIATGHPLSQAAGVCKKCTTANDCESNLCFRSNCINSNNAKSDCFPGLFTKLECDPCTSNDNCLHGGCRTKCIDGKCESKCVQENALLDDKLLEECFPALVVPSTDMIGGQRMMAHGDENKNTCKDCSKSMECDDGAICYYGKCVLSEIQKETCFPNEQGYVGEP